MIHLEQNLKEILGRGCPSCHRPHEHPEKIIENEYGRLFTLAEFWEVLEECPIQSFDLIGAYFC